VQTETLFSELSSAIFYHSQSALCGTGDLCVPSAIYAGKIFDNQQQIIMPSCSSTAKKKKISPRKLENI